MITEIGNVTVLTEVGGGFSENCTYEGTNGVAVGLVTFTGVAALGLLFSFCATMCNCCYRGWMNAADVQKGVNEGGGRLGGYWGRLFLRMAVGRCCDIIGGCIFLATVGIGATLLCTVADSKDVWNDCINGSIFHS